ncbi:NAD(P)/FAD-dependent oxidoreductase, partial [Limosilactobacillus reuteri subsp. suis]
QQNPDYTIKTNHLPDEWFRQVDKETIGDNTLIYDQDHHLVGASEVSEHAADAINVLLPAIEFQYTAEQLGRIVPLFPTLGADVWSQI